MKVTAAILAFLLGCIYIGLSSAGDKFFFNETCRMQVTSAIVPLKSGFSFSFRTCHGGVILFQEGTNNDYILMQVSPGTVNYNISVSPPNFTPSHLTLKWRVNGREDSVSVGKELDKNYFHQVTFNPGDSNTNATLTIERPFKYSVMVNQGILDFKNSGPLYTGGTFSNASFAHEKGFVGCIESGSNIPLTAGVHNLCTSGCPLDSQLGCPQKACQAGFNGDYCETNINDCAASPCHSYSTCVDGVNNYTCKCGPQWEGRHCRVFRGSLCEAKPCKNGGVCQESSDRNNYTCTCTSAWTGRNCTEPRDPCGSAPCRNGGTCQRTSANSTSFDCKCVTGFIGPTCETNINDCVLSSCKHGQCIDGINNYTCNCTGSGYKGLTCSDDIDECKPVSPCLNGATCHNYLGFYDCQCATGYNGKHCANNIDDCSPNPCKNAGTCTDGVNDYNCTCVAGFNGTNCDNNIDDCVNHNCTQNQQCIDQVNSFICQCKPGYTGSDCMVDIKECQSNPCQNNGTCNEGHNGYNCTCLPRFNGTLCAFDTVDDCIPHPCKNNGTCSDGIADFICSCPQGFSGKRCELDICDPNPCANGGNCTKINQLAYNCSCPQGFKGHNCSINIDDCVNNTCVKNATCIDGINNYTCRCPTGYRGDFCHIDINECSSNPCQNNASCTDRIGHYKCDCLTGFNGTQCEININDCPSHGCNNGTCMDGINSYTCKCDSGFEGKHCENDTNECLNSSSCVNGATCVNTIGSYYCQCNEFTNGTRCELDINECDMNSTLCNQPRGICRNLKYTGYKCYCEDGWKGKNCHINIDDCALNHRPCKNGAACTDLLNDYYCQCTTGWEGKNCDQDINECSLGYCENGASCYNSAGSYNCTCVPGYTDYNCSTDIDECADQPCKNGATCNDYVNLYNCTCVPGYNGTNCTHDIDECASNPCQHGGSCDDGINEFNCNCTSNYTGNLCQYRVSHCRPDNPCLNNGTCSDQGLDNYTCSCVPGFGGQNCENTTTISMNGSSYMAFDVSKTVFSLSLQFRTTLMYGVLAVDVDNKMLLQLKGTEIQLIYNGASDTVGRDANLANSQWHHVIVNLTTNSIHVTIDNSSCAYCTLTVQRSSQPSISKLYIGGKDGDTKRLIGCVRAVEIDGMTIIPTHSSVQIVNVVVGCPRVPVCQPNPCIHGNCIDEWLNYRCECDRPWTGNKCNTTFVAGTFGAKASLNQNSRRQRRSAQAVTSYAIFSTNTTFDGNSELSFFIKTREYDGLIAFLTSESSDHMTVIVTNGNVMVQTTVNGSKNQHTLSTKISDGQYHFVSVTVNETKVDNTTYPGITLPSAISLNKSYLGGLKDWAAFSKDVVIATKGIRGCILDMRLNNKLFHFFTSLDSYRLIERSPSVGQGCPGEDVCGPKPCSNGGTCQDIWNDFKCACKPYYGGRNCSLFGCELVQPCGCGGECLDVDNGQFECVYPATFNASLSNAQFNFTPHSNVTVKPQFSFRIRTRQTATVVFAVGSDLLVRIDNRALNVTCRVCGGSGSFISGKVINNGMWHDVLLNSSDRIYLTIDGSTVAFPGSFNGQTLRNLLTSPVTLGQNTQIPFKGCLDNLRVGGALLPFKPYYNSSYSVNHVTPLKPHFEASLKGVSCECHSDDVCSLDPCVRGKCANIWDAFKCACPVGYAGPVCNNTANMTCDHHPCLNSATCVNNYTAHAHSNDHVSDYGKDRFLCTCANGFIGRQCENVTDECSPSPCYHGTCTDLHVNYTCTCTAGYTGRQCGINIDDCFNHTCTNNATCVDGVAGYTCNCTDGFNGTYCQDDINECNAGFCQSSGTKNCTNTIGSYQCFCNGGYYGRNCQYNATQWCSVRKPCIHGNCSGNSTGFYCACDPGWEGRTCGDDIRECTSQPCNNNGTCVDSHSQGTFFPGYKCKCTVDWTGMNCNSFVNPCNATPCANNATCERIAYNKYKCNCTQGYGNMNCTGLTKFCQSNPCGNAGSCVPLHDDFSCTCKDGFIGKTCAKLVNKCDSNPCQNDGTCEQTSPGYKCSCTKAYDGHHCEQPIDFCKDNENCKYGGECVTMTQYANYTCNCTEEYTGHHCETARVVKPPSKRAASEPQSLIIGVVVACVLLILLVILLVIFCKKRSGNGTYSPSKQEMDGGRVELNSVLKPPNQERLI